MSFVWRWWATAKGPGLKVSAGVWDNLARPKVQFCCWLAWRGRVKTSSFLHRIGVLAASADIQCMFCHTAVESLEHVLLFCPLVWKYWSHMVNWWDQTWVIPGLVEGLLLWWLGGKMKPWVSRIWQVVPSVMFWSV